MACAPGNRTAAGKEFDCVEFMREARKRIDAATAGMTEGSTPLMALDGNVADVAAFVGETRRDVRESLFG